jgi:hypothetical protein
MYRFSYGLVILGCIIGIWGLTQHLAHADTVFQQIEAYAEALTWVIIPYCFSRAVAALTWEQRA